MSWRDRAIPVNTDAKTGSWRDRAIPVENWVDNLSTTEQEMHPDISMKDRLIAKNFAQSQDKQVEFFKKQYPNLEFDVSNTGQVRAKTPGSKVWKVVDPDTGIFSTDILADVGDIGYDLYSAGSEGLATTLAALGGAAATAPAGGIGALPAGMAAGAATTAANEAARQKLGQYLGIPQEVSTQDVVTSGVVGGVAPLMFGAGKAAGLIEKGAGGAGKVAAKYNPLPWIGEKVSGVPRQVLRDYADDGIRETVKKLEKEGISDYSGQIFDKLKGYIEGNKDRAGEELVQAIEGAGRRADISKAKETFQRPVDDILNQEYIRNADETKAQAIEKAYKQYFGIGDEEFLPDAISAKQAWDLQKDLKQVAKFDRDMTPADVHMKDTARTAYFDLNKSIDEASEGLSSKAKDRYKAAIKEEAELLPKFEGKTRADSIQKTYNMMSGLDRQSRQVMQEKLSKLSDDEILSLVDEAKVLSTYKWLGKPNIAPVSSGGTTSTSRTIPLAIAGGSLGSLAGYNTGGGYAGATVGGATGAALGTLLGSPAAMKAYIRAMQKAGRARELITPRDSGLWRGFKTGVGTEVMADYE